LHELDLLPAALTEMASQVDIMVGQSMEALACRNTELAEIILRRDDIVDDMNLAIEQRCITMIALQQPLGRDLRLINSAYNIITDLERIGDHGVDIAKITRKLADAAPSQTPADLFRMGGAVRSMLKEVTTALGTQDMGVLPHVIATDEEVDDAYMAFEDKMHWEMQRGTIPVVVASYFQFVAHHLDEMSHHVVSVAERLRYCVTGELSHGMHPC
jgi:phosphate transport system protein